MPKDDATTPSKAPYSLEIPRVFSSDSVHPYDEQTWSIRSAEITDDKGQAIFKQDDIEVPKVDKAQLEFLTQSEGNLTYPECGSGKVKVTGTCACCLNCGTSLGCS